MSTHTVKVIVTVPTLDSTDESARQLISATLNNGLTQGIKFIVAEDTDNDSQALQAIREITSWHIEGLSLLSYWIRGYEEGLKGRTTIPSTRAVEELLALLEPLVQQS